MTTVHARVTFQPPGPFHADARARVDDWFRVTGRSSRGGWRLGLKSAAIVGWFAASYGLLLLGHPSGWQAALLAVSLGLAWAGIGFDVMHDANHGASAKRPAWNKALAFSADLIGGSSAVWRHKHNVLHHTWTNVVGVDADLDAGALLRLAPGQPRRRGHRWQHLYVWLLYLVFPLRWFLYDDFRDVATGRIGDQPFPRPRGRQLAALLAGKALFLGWAVVLPVALHPTWWLVPIALLAVGTLGLALATVFQLAHAVGEAEFLVPAGEPIQTDWATHQVSTTVDFARGNRLLVWYLGGLNFQVVHHLFPTVSHVHYPALAPLVEAACREHGVRYRAWPSFGAALGANLRWLRQMGRPDAPGPAAPTAASVRGRAGEPARPCRPSPCPTAADPATAEPGGRQPAGRTRRRRLRRSPQVKSTKAIAVPIQPARSSGPSGKTTGSSRQASFLVHRSFLRPSSWHRRQLITVGGVACSMRSGMAWSPWSSGV
jgi:linoleoyl-CoA desaturase